MSSKEDERELLNNEFQQAWEHYRHLENARATYMQFFYTVIFAAFGFLITLHEQFKELSSVGLAALLVALSVFSTYIYLNVSKIKYVREHYMNTVNEIRKIMYSDYESRIRLFDFRLANNGTSTSPLGSIQQSTELILIISMLVLDLAVLYSIYLGELCPSLTFTIVLLIGIIFFIQVYLVRKFFPSVRSLKP